MFCEKCGNELQENEKVCAKCGAPVVETAPSQEQSQTEPPAVSESNSTKNTPEDRLFKTPESCCHFMGVLASVITIIFGFLLKLGKIGGITVKHITYGEMRLPAFKMQPQIQPLRCRMVLPMY